MLSDAAALSHRPYRSRTTSLEVVSSQKPTSPIKPDGRHSSPSYNSSLVSKEVRHIRVLHRRAASHSDPAQTSSPPSNDRSRPHSLLVRSDRRKTPPQLEAPHGLFDARTIRQNESNRNISVSPDEPLGLRLASPFIRSQPPDLTGQIARIGTDPAAQGGFGIIWRCKWVCGRREVAVKQIRSFKDEDDQEKQKKNKKLRRELKVWTRLNHRNIVPLYGTTTGFGHYVAMVSPWATNGPLTAYLQRCHRRISKQTQLHILQDVAAGLQYLHSQSVIHGDLTGTNVLIAADGTACLADFGLSMIYHEFWGTSYLTSSIHGNVRWAAPEVFGTKDAPNGVLPGTQTDVYSFGCVMYQVLSGKIPYYDVPYETTVLIQMSNGTKPRRPTRPVIEDELWGFVQRCWALPGRKSSRPSPNEIIKFLAFQLQLHASKRMD